MKILVPTDFSDIITTALKYVNTVFSEDATKYVLNAFMGTQGAKKKSSMILGSNA